MKQYISLLVIAIITIGGVAYYQYNKGEVNIQNAEGIKVNAATLYEAFAKDSLKAKNIYAEKILNVEGEVSAISKNQSNLNIVQLKTATDGAYINCTAETPNDINNLKSGDKVNIKGVCKGIGEGDVDMGILGDVYLIRCHTTNKQ